MIKFAEEVEDNAYLRAAFACKDGRAIAHAGDIELAKGQREKKRKRVQKALELFQQAERLGTPVQSSINQCLALLRTLPN